jgi:uncharacterized protein (DUF3084 family)
MTLKLGDEMIENSNYHTPPRASATRQEMEIQKLQQENRRLEAVVEVLCKQNSQMVEAHNQRNLFAKKERKGLDQVHHALDRLEQVMDRVKRTVQEMTDIRYQSQSMLQEMLNQASSDWHDFCVEMDVGELEVEKVLEDIKERIIEKDTEEIFIGMM